MIYAEKDDKKTAAPLRPDLMAIRIDRSGPDSYNLLGIVVTVNAAVVVKSDLDLGMGARRSFRVESALGPREGEL